MFLYFAHQPSALVVGWGKLPPPPANFRQCRETFLVAVTVSAQCVCPSVCWFPGGGGRGVPLGDLQCPGSSHSKERLAENVTNGRTEVLALVTFFWHPFFYL